MAGKQDFVCSLTVASVKKAKKELNEDPKERQRAITALRQWTEREPWIQCPPNPVFLLSFLRTGKFSQLTARERLVKFMTSLEAVSTNLLGTDPGDDVVVDVIRKSKSLLVLPGVDKDGLRCVLIRAGRIAPDDKSYTHNQYTNALWSVLLGLTLFEENTQVNGIFQIWDLDGVSMSTVNFIGLDAMRRHCEFFSKAIPLRIKRLHFIRMSPVAEAVLSIFKPMLSKKLQDRIQVHGNNMVAVYKKEDMSLLPDEYLPDDYIGPTAGSVDTIAEETIKEYLLNSRKRSFMKDLFSGRYRVDQKVRDSLGEAQASFRKLNVS